MPYNYFVYIVTNAKKNTLYTGVTNDMQRRLSEDYFDSQNAKKSFAGKYNCFHLVYFQAFDSIEAAILREKEIKKWRREKKDKLISDFNLGWKFLNKEVF